jgi:tetratricopeptide (TPR) repeat protein
VDEPAEALRAAQSGLDVLRRASRDPDLEARLLAIQARGHAALGGRGECARSLALAEAALQVAREEPRSEWVSGFDEGALASDAARCMRTLGQLSEARRQAERVIALCPAGRPRSRAFGQFILAGVLVAEGKLDEAIAIAADILRSTDSLGSYIIVQQFRDLQRSLLPYKTAATVAGFLAGLDPALRDRVWFRDNILVDGVS